MKSGKEDAGAAPGVIFLIPFLLLVAVAARTGEVGLERWWQESRFGSSGWRAPWGRRCWDWGCAFGRAFEGGGGPGARITPFETA
jgi:hypothetical protein